MEVSRKSKPRRERQVGPHPGTPKGQQTYNFGVATPGKFMLGVLCVFVYVCLHTT